MRKIFVILCLIVALALGLLSLVANHVTSGKFYNLHLKLEEIKAGVTNFQDTIINSPIYGMLLYMGGVIGIFIIGVIVFFLLITILRR